MAQSSFVEVSNVPLQTRYGLAPLNSALFHADGSANELCRSFYASFCSRQLGLLTIGGVAVREDGRANASALVLTQQESEAGIRTIVADAHSQGVKVGVQLEHAGRQVRSTEIGQQPVAASAIACPVINEIPRALSRREIWDIVQSFANAAELAAIAGADLLEVHAAHGYLISGFISPKSNIRTDSYGGDTPSRYRILDEILSAIGERTAIPVGVRLNVYESSTAEDVTRDVLDGVFSLSHKPAYLSVTAGSYTSGEDLIMPRRALGRALWRTQARRLKSALKLPIFLAGNVDTVELADELIEDGSADVVLFGRAMLADPKLLLKRAEHQALTECTDCRMCKYHSTGRLHIYCPLNPVLIPTRGAWPRRGGARPKDVL